MNEDDCCEANETENKERTTKIKNYLWCAEKSDKDLENFANLGDAVRKVKNQTLTKAYFHPSTIVFQHDISRLSEVRKSVIDEHVIGSSDYNPPEWYIDLSKKQVDTFIKLFDLLEKPQTTASDRKIIQAIQTFGMTDEDLEDLKEIYELRNLNNLDFEEFLYSLVTLDVIKKVISRSESHNEHIGRGDMSETQSTLYSALVQFTVAACCVCNNIAMDGINQDIRTFFECKLVCMDRFSNCIYQRLKTKFKELPNYSCSPYYHSLKYFKQAMNLCAPNKKTAEDCKKSMTTNPYIHHLIKNPDGGSIITDDIVKGVFETYTKNGCLITSLPDAHWVPIIRILIAKISIFEPVCCSPKRRENIQKILNKYKDNAAMKIQRRKKVKELQNKKLKLSLPKTKINLKKPCTKTKDDLNCFTPVVYSRLIRKSRELDLENRRRIFAAEAARNRIIKYQLDFNMFPEGTGERFKEIFELYNPTDAKQFYLDFSELKYGKDRKVDKELDPDVFK